MHEKWKNLIGLTVLLLAICVAVTSFRPLAFAAELETQPQETQTQETQTAEPEVTESIIPLADSDVTTDDSGILLQWDLDSSLTYVLDEDDYVWTIFDASGNKAADTGATPASAGYTLTGKGTWYGEAKVTLTITNYLQEQAQLRLLFMDTLSESALEISSTLESINENVTYDPASGLMVIQPGVEGVVSMVIKAEALQKAEAVITEEENIAGWIRVQVVSPVMSSETAETAEIGTEDTAEPPAEATEPTTEPPQAPTETTAPSTQVTEAPTEATEPSTEATEAPTEATEPSTEVTEAPTGATEPSTEATEAPTEATEAPTEATEAPTEAATSPTEAPAAQTETGKVPTDDAEPETDA